MADKSKMPDLFHQNPISVSVGSVLFSDTRKQRTSETGPAYPGGYQ